jgi:hypothetical protein
MTENESTLQVYEEKSAEYIAGTPPKMTSDVSGWIERMIAFLSSSMILEIGSAFGREADFFESKGCLVQRTDAAQSFVNLLTRKGHSAYTLNAITDDLGGPWGLIFANCVFLHFTKEEFRTTLVKILDSLDTRGVLGFAVKRGKGSEWHSQKVGSPRFFQYWNQQELHSLLAETGFELLDIRDGKTDGDSDKIYVIARKLTS